ncbi:MAG: segregation/condensation protein A, partial [Chloroflexota bacterium]|nr:segregation/condensation protein A [Chloroflexota bacterium]
ARQLEEYRRFKAAAQSLRELKDTRGPSYGRHAGPPDIPPAINLTGLDVDRLVASFHALLNRKLAEPSTQEVTISRVTQADRVAAVEAVLGRARTMMLDALMADCRTVEDVIVTFLTLLELLKQRRIRLWQRSPFGAIIISRPAPAMAKNEPC